MANEKSLTIVIVLLALVAGIAIGAAGTLFYLRNDIRATATNALPASGNASVATPNSGAAMGTPGTPAAAASAVPAGTGVFINEKQLTAQQRDMLLQAYGAAPPQGHFWYDPRSGLYGLWGYEAAGFIRPGHDFGAVPANASNGTTGVFINGRQINMNEAMYLQKLFGAVYQGRWWLDGQTGNIGMEGNPTPIANVVLAVQQAQQRSGGGSGGGGYRYYDSTSRTSAGAENGCVWINVPGSGSAMGSGCN